MPLPLFTAYLNTIPQLRAEELLYDLAIANDPKPTYEIDPKKSKLGGLREEIINLAQDGATIPYYMDTKFDRAGLARLKAKMAEAQSKRRA